MNRESNPQPMLGRHTIYEDFDVIVRAGFFISRGITFNGPTESTHFVLERHDLNENGKWKTSTIFLSQSAAEELFAYLSTAITEVPAEIEPQLSGDPHE